MVARTLMAWLFGSKDLTSSYRTEKRSSTRSQNSEVPWAKRDIYTDEAYKNEIPDHRLEEYIQFRWEGDKAWMTQEQIDQWYRVGTAIPSESALPLQPDWSKVFPVSEPSHLGTKEEPTSESDTIPSEVSTLFVLLEVISQQQLQILRKLDASLDMSQSMALGLQNFFSLVGIQTQPTPDTDGEPEESNPTSNPEPSPPAWQGKVFEDG